VARLSATGAPGEDYGSAEAAAEAEGGGEAEAEGGGEDEGGGAG